MSDRAEQEAEAISMVVDRAADLLGEAIEALELTGRDRDDAVRALRILEGGARGCDDRKAAAATDPPEWVAEDAPAPEVAPDPVEREEPPGVEEFNEIEQAERDEELRAVDDYARAAIRHGEYPG